jgi:DNA-binding transcriptional ArsR family regulator
MINLQPYGKFAYDIIRYLDEHPEVKITDLLKVVKSPDTLYRTLPKLQAADIIKEKDRVDRRRFVYIYLTDKGKRIAEGLKTAEQAVSSEEDIRTLPPNYTDQFKNLSALTHLNVLDDHIAIRDLNFDGTGHDRVVFVYVKLNGNNLMRLWCEVDNTYDCVHTKYAWSLPDVQAMVQIQYAKGNINRLQK